MLITNAAQAARVAKVRQCHARGLSRAQVVAVIASSIVDAVADRHAPAVAEVWRAAIDAVYGPAAVLSCEFCPAEGGGCCVCNPH